MAVAQVKIINGQKVLVPVSGSTPIDEVTLNNMQSVTSNAVAKALEWTKAGIFTANQTVTIPSTAKEVSISLFRNSDYAVFNGNQTPLTYIADGTVSMIIAWIGGDAYVALRYTGRDSQNNYTFTAPWGSGDWSVIVFYR